MSKTVRVVAFHNVETLCGRIGGLDPTHVLNVYIIGSSSIEGAATIASDLNCVMVVDDETPGRKWKNADWLRTHGWVAPSPDGQKGMFKGFCQDYCSQKGENVAEYDIWIYTESSFRLVLEQQVPFGVECLFLPTSSIWRQEIEFSLSPNKKQLLISFCAVSQLHLWRAGFEFASRTTMTSKKRSLGLLGLKIEKWDLNNSKNTLFFALRFLEYAKQLIESESQKTNLENFQSIKQQLLEVESDNWNDHMQVFQPLHERGVDQLRQVLPFDFDPMWLLKQNKAKHKKLDCRCKCKYCDS